MMEDIPSSIEDSHQKVTRPYEVSAILTASPDSWKRVGSDEPGHEYLVGLSSPKSSEMADRFPSLEEFGAGKLPSHLHCPGVLSNRYNDFLSLCNRHKF